jgi:uncharacterized protein DUF6220
MRPLLRQVHAWLAWGVVGAIVIQVWLAGSAIPQLGGNGSFAMHRDFGYLIGLFTLLLLISAIGAGASRRRIGQAAGLIGLYVIQSSLPYMGIGAIEALHPVNAVVMFVAAAWYARTVWNERTAATA